MRNAIGAAALAAELVLSSGAQAVIVDQGDIDTDATNKTVDLWFFSLPTAADAVIVVSPIAFGMDVLSGLEDPELLIYVNDGSLDAADFLIGADDTPPFGLTPQVTTTLAAGDYVFAISASNIDPGQFGPTAALAPGTVPFTYELGISDEAGSEGTLTCVLEGRLDGSFDRRVIGLGPDNCVEATETPEPASFAVLGLALAGLGALRFAPRGRAGNRAARR